MSPTGGATRRKVEISRPGKVLFPSGITKRDLASYYERVAEAMLVHLARRPLLLERYPRGIEGPRVIQQHTPAGWPPWIRRVEVPGRARPVTHVVAATADTLVYLAGQDCVALHRWLARSDLLERPDLLVFDLDPAVSRPAEVRGAAQIVGALLRELGLEPWVMTTGSRGYHVAVPLRRRAGFDAVREFARGFARLAVTREPKLFTDEQRKERRSGRIYIDVMRNAYAHTAIAPYSVRALPDGPVATPLDWEELGEANTTAGHWTLASVPDRLAREGEPWSRIHENPQTLTRARERLTQALAESRDRAA